MIFFLFLVAFFNQKSAKIKRAKVIMHNKKFLNNKINIFYDFV